MKNRDEQISSSDSSAIKTLQNLFLSMALVRKRTILTERPPLVGEVSANFCR
jgi:hypothetical protein